MVQVQVSRSQQESSDTHRTEKLKPTQLCGLESYWVVEGSKWASISLTSASGGHTAHFPFLLTLLQPHCPAFFSLSRSGLFLPSGSWHVPYAWSSLSLDFSTNLFFLADTSQFEFMHILISETSVKGTACEMESVLPAAITRDPATSIEFTCKLIIF